MPSWRTLAAAVAALCLVATAFIAGARRALPPDDVRQSQPCSLSQAEIAAAVAGISLSSPDADQAAASEVAWDARSAVLSLLYKTTRRLHNCKNMLTLGGTRKQGDGDGSWPLCFDFGWEEVMPASPRPARRNAFASLDVAGIFGAATGDDRPRFRRVGRHAELDRGNKGANGGCVSFGFGVDWDFDWDDRFHATTGCDVHSFDPSMEMESTDRGDRRWFWNIGISTRASNDTVGTQMRTGKKVKFHLDTLPSLMRRLGLRRLAVLKIDVEGAEFPVLLSLARSGVLRRVDQLLVEVHYWRSAALATGVPGLAQDAAAARGWEEVLDSVEKAGLVPYYAHTNPMSSNVNWGDITVREVPCCFEIGYVRTGEPEDQGPVSEAEAAMEG